jgi:hypothetical protein
MMGASDAEVDGCISLWYGDTGRPETCSRVQFEGLQVP